MVWKANESMLIAIMCVNNKYDKDGKRLKEELGCSWWLYKTGETYVKKYSRECETSDMNW